MRQDTSYADILRQNRQLAKSMTGDKYEIKVLSNITVAHLNDILEYSLRNLGVPAIVGSGDYDNIVQDSFKFKDSPCIIIFWELCNIVDNLHFRVELLTDEETRSISNQVESELDLVLANLSETSLVLINKFNSRLFSAFSLHGTKLEALAKHLNEYLSGVLPRNVQLVELDNIFLAKGLDVSVDMRRYYSTRSIYTIDFFKAYTQYIQPFITAATGRSKKTIIFDCDNTLWKGVLGEDGFDGIEMSPRTKHGSIFFEIQTMALCLQQQGVILTLCSKNNRADVEEVIANHPDMQLTAEHIAVNRSNWSDKVSNIRAISEELGIGLDSCVFIDDSPLETELVRQQLPQVTVLLVPQSLDEYPKLLRNNIGLFFNPSLTKEDAARTEMYRAQAERMAARSTTSTVDEYLASLMHKAVIHEDDHAIVARMAQMSQRTNQFNLTTRRYTEEDIRTMVDRDESKVLALSLSDKFGDSGVTGLCIIHFTSTRTCAEIDTLLMSCRIIGRNVEYAFMDHIIARLRSEQVTHVEATYVKTAKNEQVENFFDRCSFTVNKRTDLTTDYTLQVDEYVPKSLEYIEIVDD